MVLCLGKPTILYSFDSWEMLNYFRVTKHFDIVSQMSLDHFQI